MPHFRSRILLGTLFLMAGVAVGLSLAGVFSIDEESVHAPKWVLALLGMLFLGGGISTIVSPRSGIAAWSAGIVVVTITIVSAWVALYGSSAHFSGDIPFLSSSTNVFIARIVFGSVSLLGLAIIVAAALKPWGRGDA